MVSKEARFECQNCRKENWVEIDPSTVGKSRIILTCCNCGGVNEPQGTEEKASGTWLQCIAYTGLSKDHVAGRHESSTKRVIYTDADGKRLTRNEFIIGHGWDPEIIWCATHPNKPECSWYKDRCKGKGFKRKTQPFAEVHSHMFRDRL